MHLSGWKRLCLLCLCALVPVGACVRAPASGSFPAVEAALRIRAIKEKPTEFSGSRVALSGSFRGWKGSCLSPPPVSRSDWMLEDGSGCIYVHAPVPPGLDLLNPGDESLTVEGTVLLDRRGHPYLEGSAR